MEAVVRMTMIRILKTKNAMILAMAILMAMMMIMAMAMIVHNEDQHSVT